MQTFRPARVRGFRYAWTGFLVCATSFPYFLNYASSPAGYRYTWILPPYPEDSLGYLSWSEQAARGALLFKVKYTALPQTPFLFHPFFLICGWLSRAFSIDLGLTHFIVKEIGVVLFFLVFYKYNDFLGLTDFQTVAASILIGMSSGFGGMLALTGIAGKLAFRPADLWIPELSTYWSLLWNPLFPYSLMLMLLVIYLIDRASKDKRKADMWLAGLTAGALALIHPYSQPLLVAFAGILIAFRLRSEWLRYLVRYCVAVAPFDLYIVLLSEFQPVVAQHSARGAMKSPPVPALLVGFGLPLLIFLFGFAVEQGRSMIRRYGQLGLWFLLSFVFAYVPFWFQRKLLLGSHIPLCILAAVSLDAVFSRIAPFHRNRALTFSAVLLVPLLIATPICLLHSAQTAIKVNSAGAYFVSDDVLNGMQYLREHSRPQDLVLARLATSRFIPVYSGNTVLWGHWAMSVDFEQRMAWSKALFGTKQDWYDPQRSTAFWSSGIGYVFADQDIEQSIENSPWEWDVILRQADKVFQNHTVTIYKYRAPTP